MTTPLDRPPREPLAFAEWWDDLLWPRVLTGAGLGLRPNRLGLAFFAVVIGALLIGLGNTIDGINGDKRFAIAAAFSTQQVTDIPWRWFIHGPHMLVRVLPWTTLLFGPLVAAAWLPILGAMCRMTAVDASQGRGLSWTEGLGFAVARWRALLGAVLTPLVIVWFIALVAAAAGSFMLRWPGLNILGALLYFLILAAGLLAVLAAGAYIVGGFLLIPAVVCEGADAIDAVQRTFAYVTARLPRLLLYKLLGAIGVIFLVVVIALLATWTIDFAAHAAGLWAGQRARDMLWSTVSNLPLFGPGLGVNEGTFDASARIIRFWTAIPLAFVSAAALSCAASAATMVYLALRRVCDGQDIAELWTPGAVEAGMAESLSGRAELSRAAIEQAGTEDIAENPDE